ncbi:MAG: hypothetical protein RLZZ182_416 [Pseudomonadota bacterium]
MPRLELGLPISKTDVLTFTPHPISGRCRSVVWVAGFEPAASAFQARPSTGLTIHPDVEVAGRGRAFMMMRLCHIRAMK